MEKTDLSLKAFKAEVARICTATAELHTDIAPKLMSFEEWWELFEITAAELDLERRRRAREAPVRRAA